MLLGSQLIYRTRRQKIKKSSQGTIGLWLVYHSTIFDIVNPRNCFNFVPNWSPPLPTAIRNLESLTWRPFFRIEGHECRAGWNVLQLLCDCIMISLFEMAYLFINWWFGLFSKIVLINGNFLECCSSRFLNLNLSLFFLFFFS